MIGKTKIPWCDYSLNPIKGLCPVACEDLEGKEYCYARRMYKRFKWNPEIRLANNAFYQFYELKRKKPSKVFVGSTMELFGPWVKDEWMHGILSYCKAYSQHTFIFLTKYPQEMGKWEFPDNCWVGASADTYYHMFKATRWLPEVQARIKFISFEPLLESVAGVRFNLQGIDWVILGSRTAPVRHPKPEWVREIIAAADKAGIPVFVKSPLSDFMGIQRQEFPKRLI